MKRIYAFEERCLGCKLCEVYCKTAHSKSRNIIKANKYENIESAIFIEEVIEKKSIVYFALQCRHCKNPKCVKACISGAMYKGEDGIVRNNSEKCVSCLSCVLVCPFGAIKVGKDGQTISKCDLCVNYGTSLCVDHCPNDAIKLIEENDDCFTKGRL